jgi:hypothetical protein
LLLLDLELEMQVCEVSNTAVDNPLHARQATAVLQLYAQSGMAIALLLGRAIRVGNGDLQLLEENGYPLVAMFVALEHTREKECGRRSCEQFGHELGRLGMVDLALSLLPVAQQLEAVLDGLPLLGTQTRRALTTHPPWRRLCVAGSTPEGGQAPQIARRPALGALVFGVGVVSSQAAIGEATGTVQPPCPGTLLRYARAALVLRVPLALVLGYVVHGGAAQEARARGRGRHVGRVAREEGAGRLLRRRRRRLGALALAVEPAAAALPPPLSRPGGARLAVGVGFAVLHVEARLVEFGRGRQLAVR